jgi:hypothetical protein
MDTVRVTTAQQINVADRVTVTDGQRTFVGHVARKGRTHATVVTDDGRELRAPYALLSRMAGAPRQHVQGRTDTLRTQFQAGERVRFTAGAAACFGVISRLNPRYAHVVCDDEQEYRVPYARLTSLAPQPVMSPEVPARTAVVYALFADNVPRLLASPLRGVQQQVMRAHIGFSGPRSACLASSRTHRPHAISRASGSAPAYTA